MNVERRLARYAANLKYDDIPESALEAFRRLFLDATSVMLAGYKSVESRRIAESLAQWGGQPVCSVTGRIEKIPPPEAAFINGVYTHWSEWDDTHDESHVHGGAVIFPSLMAVAEERSLTEGESAGRAFIEAAVAAYDIACRIGGLLKPHSHRGWMSTGSGGAVGTAAGIARLIGLDENGILSAMGLAAAGAGLSRQGLADKVNGKNILAGQAAKNAIDAGFLASAGAIGAPNYLTGVYGLHELHAGGMGDAETVTVDLMEHFSISDVSVKPYPCCRSNHPALDMVFDVMAEDPEAVRQIDSVHVLAPEGLYERCGAPFEPGDNPRVSAQFSMPFTLALALRKGSISPEDFETDRILADDTGIGNLIKKITVEAVPLPPESDDIMVPVTVRFHLTNGQAIERTADRVKGSPSRPLSSMEERAKVMTAVHGILEPLQINQLIDSTAAVSQRGPGSVMDIIRLARV